MIRLLLSALIRLLANALGLLVAAAVLKDFSLTASGFLFAVLVFTLVEVLIDPLLTKIAIQSVPALRGGVALVTTFVGLLITQLATKGLHIHGLSTWLFATLIVWLAALLAGLLLPLVLVHRAVEDRKERH